MQKSKKKLKLDKSSFSSFLDSISKISDSAILNVENDRIYSISSSEDRAMYLWSNLEADNDDVVVLNIPSVSKLKKALNLIPEDDVEFVLNSNNIEYIGKQVKFKYHLYDDGILVAPKVTLKKIESLKFEHSLDLTKEFLQFIIKQSSIFKDTKKLYIQTEDGKLYWSLEDKRISNTDSLTIEGEDVDFELETPFIVNLDNLKLITFGACDKFVLKISEIGVGNIVLKKDNTELNYVITSLTS